MPCFVIESAETFRQGRSAPVVKWLESEGFKGRTQGGHLGGGMCKPWLFVDIDGKEFIYGVWGAAATGPVIGQTHLTIGEFKTIYAIICQSRQRMKDVPSWQKRIGIEKGEWPLVVKSAI